MKVVINATQEDDNKAVSLNEKTIELGTEVEINQSEYMLLMDETVEVEGLPRRRYDIEVITMVDTEPEPEPLSEEEEAHVKRITDEFQELEVLYQQAVNMMETTNDKYNNGEGHISTEAAIQAATAIYIQTKKEMK